MMLGLGLSLCSPGGSSAVDPATLNFSIWNRASFASTPWAGVDSAGSSGSRSLAVSNQPPTVGTALNSLNPADFNGTDEAITYATTALDTVVTASAYTYALLVKPRSPAATAGGQPYSDAQLVGDSGAIFGLAFTTSGVRAYHDDGATTPTDWVACSANAYHWIVVRFGSGTLGVSVDSGAFTTVAKGNVASLSASNLRVGRNFSTLYASMLLAEIMVSPTALSDATLTSLRSGYIASRYGI